MSKSKSPSAVEDRLGALGAALNKAKAGGKPTAILPTGGKNKAQVLRARGASETIDVLAGRVVSEANYQHTFTQGPICATLVGLDRCKVDGITVRGASTALALALLPAGIDPGRLLAAGREARVLLQHEIGTDINDISAARS